jgi:glyoxylase-like metal-dependent hydrolase (beta-lactamase superfamily II)
MKYELSNKPGVPESVLPGVRRIVCNNPGPQTAQGTNTWLIGQQRIAVIDPGPSDPQHLRAILRATSGQLVTHIIVTHRHLDHSGGSKELSRAVGAPIYGFSSARHAMRGQGIQAFVPDIGLDHGDILKVEDLTLTALHTPGHCPTHLCFAMNPGSILFSGDQIMAWAVTAVTPPDGDIADYLSSLELIAKQDVAICFPAHGGPIEDLSGLAARYARQIKSRERQVLSIVGQFERATSTEIAKHIYGDLLDTGLRDSILGTLSSHLLHLASQGRVHEKDGVWSPS